MKLKSVWLTTLIPKKLFVLLTRLVVFVLGAASCQSELEVRGQSATEQQVERNPSTISGSLTDAVELTHFWVGIPIK